VKLIEVVMNVLKDLNAIGVQIVQHAVALDVEQVHLTIVQLDALVPSMECAQLA